MPNVCQQKLFQIRNIKAGNNRKEKIGKLLKIVDRGVVYVKERYEISCVEYN